MTKIKIQVSDLQKICELVSMKGKDQLGKVYRAVTGMLIEAKGATLAVTTTDILKVVTMKLEYTAVEVLEEGQLPIGSIENFEKFLDRFDPSDTVVVYTLENKIIIERENPRKIAKMPLEVVESTFVGSPFLGKLVETKTGFWKSDKIHFNLKVSFDVEAMQNIIADGDVVKQRAYPWLIKNGKLFVSIGNETYGEIATEIAFNSLESDPENSGKQQVETCFAQGIDNIFGNLYGNVLVYLVDESKYLPIVIEQKSDKYNLLAVLAPFSKE